MPLNQHIPRRLRPLNFHPPPGDFLLNKQVHPVAFSILLLPSSLKNMKNDSLNCLSIQQKHFPKPSLSRRIPQPQNPTAASQELDTFSTSAPAFASTSSHTGGKVKNTAGVVPLMMWPEEIPVTIIVASSLRLCLRKECVRSSP